MFRLTTMIALVLITGAASSAVATPQYDTIIDLGIIDPGDFGSQAFRVSSGGIATGRTLGVSNQAFSWSQLGGTVPLPNFPSRAYGVGNGVNDSGMVVGTGAATAWGANPLPLVWQNGVVSQLPLPAGQSLGRANDVNASGVAVGSVNGGSLEAGVIYSGGSASIITATTGTGCFIRTAFSINNAGRVVGFGIDPNSAARNVGFIYDSASGTAFEVGALTGHNGALAFDVSEAGHVVGSSMLYQGSGLPFIWTDLDGISEIPLPAGTSQGSARGVNSSGWAVGTASSAYAIPFLFDGTDTYRIQDLLPAGSGWDLSTNTSSSAMSISEDGIIVGTGIINGDTRAYALIPVPEPSTIAFLVLLAPMVFLRR